MKEYEFYGDIYVKVPDEEKGSCSGCDLQGRNCHRATWADDCSRDGHIFKLKENTVEENISKDKKPVLIITETKAVECAALDLLEKHGLKGQDGHLVSRDFSGTASILIDSKGCLRVVTGGSPYSNRDEWEICGKEYQVYRAQLLTDEIVSTFPGAQPLEDPAVTEAKERIESAQKELEAATELLNSLKA
jgi:hypothetical protein